jgi:GNAT superfamily N-acetyltransferase
MLSFRNATPADLPFIIGLVVEDSVTDSGDDPADATHADYLNALAIIDADPNQEVIVVESLGERVACFQLTYVFGLTQRGKPRGQIEMVHVTAPSRSLGIGSEMIRWAIDRCRARGCAIVQLTSNKKRLDAHRLYERLGFMKSHEGFKYYL